jgi:hypothetical protein
MYHSQPVEKRRANGPLAPPALDAFEPAGETPARLWGAGHAA